MTGQWAIGGQNCSPCNSNRFHGALDEVAIYDQVIFEARIQAHYAAGKNR